MFGAASFHLHACHKPYLQFNFPMDYLTCDTALYDYFLSDALVNK